MEQCELGQGVWERRKGKSPRQRLPVNVRQKLKKELGGTPGDRLEVHHKCHQPLCVNVLHLKLLTKLEHMLEHGIIAGPKLCKRGHPMQGPEADVLERPGIGRHCRRCNRARTKARALKLAAEKPLKPPKTACRNGHSLAEFGRRPSGVCRECARLREHKRYYANLSESRRKARERMRKKSPQG